MENGRGIIVRMVVARGFGDAPIRQAGLRFENVRVLSSRGIRNMASIVLAEHLKTPFFGARCALELKTPEIRRP